MQQNIFEPVRNAPVRRKRKSVAGPSAPQVLVVSVVAQDGGAVITFSLPVSLNEDSPGATIRFTNGPQSGYAEDLSPVGENAIFVNAIPGVTIAAGCSWSILALPPCFVLPPDAVLPVPQNGVVE